MYNKIKGNIWYITSGTKQIINKNFSKLAPSYLNLITKSNQRVQVGGVKLRT